MKPELFQNISNIITVIGIILTAIGGYGAYYFGGQVEVEKDRINKVQSDSLNKNVQTLLQGNEILRSEIEPFKEYAKKLYPRESEEKALENLKNSLDQLRLTVDKETKTIKSLRAILKVKFSGNWDEQPYPQQLISPINDLQLLRLSVNQNNKADFFATENYHFQTLGKQQAEFVCRLAIKPGSYPIGQPIEVLKTLNTVDFWVHLIQYENIKDGKILVQEFEITFLVNDNIQGVIGSKVDHYTDVRVLFDNKSAAWAGVTFNIMGTTVYNSLVFP